MSQIWLEMARDETPYTHNDNGKEQQIVKQNDKISMYTLHNGKKMNISK